MEELSPIQVLEHNTRKDAWIIIHGLVYDVTKYLDDHPGGADVLIETAGGDASEEFDNAGHSEDAFELMEGYCVGKLKGFEKKKPKLKPVEPVVRVEKLPPSSTTKGSSVSKLANITVFSAAVAAVYHVSRRQGVSLPFSLPVSLPVSLPQWTVSHIRSGSSQQSGLGFFKGALIGGGVSAVVAVVLAKRFAAQIWSSKSFTSYPAHVKMPKRIEEDTLLERGLLDPVSYKTLPLKAKTLIAPNVYRFTFSLPTTKTVLGLPIGQHVTIKADVGGESVARSYTPVSNNSDRGVLELVTKVYENGKLSGYLANLTPGDQVLFRGPKGSMRYRPGLCKKIGMIAGGTGITPMYQVIRAICENERDTTEVSLIYANRTEDDILLRQELDTFAKRYPKNFKVYYMLDHPPADWAFGSGFVTQDIMAERLPAPGVDSKIMVCGPPGMVNASKKALVNLGFKQPGASAKASDEIFCF
ncbi:putative cytochrome b5 reductase [Coniochaeta ligniaria NRRL 30616]|uniref:NADH-cytochrome b5 reductase 1 n=1 Tax=Coniochaeta ligniaria NRRL 30616 TaxID=1408157 RepID=A0A1J7JSY7_9PEZI|nr:putative cytochrome b5 reductase [Coniochaeta ligniaria NRRL 30616]